jgi:uncharacterized SAM-binding protein YcdF (DUF218 family)
MVVLLLFLFFIIFLLLFSIWIHTFPIKEEKADVLIILGYKCDHNKIHPFLEERLLAGLSLLQRYPFKKVIVTGGKVSSTVSEAEIMKAYLAKNQVDEDTILLENEAANTIENLLNCKTIMKAHNLKTCIILSNSFHLRRIRYIANSLGFTCDFYCDRSSKAIVRQGFRTINELRIFIKTFYQLNGIQNQPPTYRS